MCLYLQLLSFLFEMNKHLNAPDQQIENIL